MKRILLFLAVCLLVTCNSGEKRLARQVLKQREDSLASIRQARINDSLAIIEKQNKQKEIELSKIAYGDALFGMSFKEALKTDVFKDGKVGNDTRYLNSKSEEYRKIGGTYWDVTGVFYNDTLYLVTIESPKSVTADDIETDLVKQVNILKGVIDQKFGAPDEKYGKPGISEFEPGGIMWMYRWNIEDRTIKLGMALTDSIVGYKTTCYSSHEPTVQLIIRNRKEAARTLLTRDASKF
jgi:hypothetical protein